MLDDRGRRVVRRLARQNRWLRLRLRALTALSLRLVAALARKNEYIRRLEARIAEWKKFPPP